MRFKGKLALLSALWVLMLEWRVACAEYTVEEIVERVRENELLYQNIDVSVTFTYRTYNRPQRPKKAPEPGGLVAFEILTQDQQHRFVNQGDFFRLDRSTDQTYEGREPGRVVELEAFDGVTHRALVDKTANVTAGRREPSSPLYPHILLLGIRYPLSVHLGGEEAMKAHPAAQRQAAPIELRLVGVEEVDGLRCYKLEHIRIKPGAGPSAKTEIWLAEERNFIPAKVQIYGLWQSRTEPGTVAHVLEWQEIAPGVWYPSHTQSRHYFIFLPHEPGKALLNWQKERRLERIALNPDHDITFFRPEFPEGTAVYEVAKGEIANSYRVGAPGSAPVGGAARSVSRSWTFWIGLTMAVAVVVLYMRVRRRARSRALASAAPGANEPST